MNFPTSHKLSVILFAVVSLLGAAATAIGNLPQGTTIQYDILFVAAAVVTAAWPQVSDQHAQKIGQHIAGGLQEGAAMLAPASTPIPTPTPDPVTAPVDPAPVTPVAPVVAPSPDPGPVAPATPAVNIANLVAQLQTKRAEEDALLTQLSAVQGA